jgi:hypothetical protein
LVQEGLEEIQCLVQQVAILFLILLPPLEGDSELMRKLAGLVVLLVVEVGLVLEELQLHPAKAITVVLVLLVRRIQLEEVAVQEPQEQMHLGEQLDQVEQARRTV